MIRTIMVPVDGSAFGEYALPVALGVAERTGATLELDLAHDSHAEAAGLRLVVTGVPTFQLPTAARLEEARAERAAYLTTLRQRLQKTSGLYVRVELLEGRAIEVLAERARQRADLVVMSTHARGGLRRLWLGSVADCLIRDGMVPLLLVKPEEEASPVLSATLHRFRHVLVPVDGSALAEAVLQPLIDVVGNDRERVILTLLQVQSPPPLSPATTLHAASFPPTADLPGSASGAVDYPGDVAGRLRSRGLHVQFRTVVHEQTGRAIVETAREMCADLIAIATHGRTGVRRFLLGSVADEVVRGAQTAVLVYRPAA